MELSDKSEKADRLVRKQIMIENALDPLVESDIKVRKPNFRTR